MLGSGPWAYFMPLASLWSQYSTCVYILTLSYSKLPNSLHESLQIPRPDQINEGIVHKSCKHPVGTARYCAGLVVGRDSIMKININRTLLYVLAWLAAAALALMFAAVSPNEPSVMGQLPAQLSQT